MTSNQEIEIARKYHEATKHSLGSIQSDRHYLDWDNHPAPFKIYRRLEGIPLPHDLPTTGVPALQALSTPGIKDQGPIIPDLSQIAYLLYYSAGVTKLLRYPNGAKVFFRAAACAGALYPVEIYLVCGDLPGLPAGVFHFSPAEFALKRLRGGDWRGWLARTAGEEEAILEASAVLIYTAITWRSSWKYRARAYRYHFWDCGMILANSLAACDALGLPSRVVLGFVDAEVNFLLGIDGKQEKTLALLPFGWTGDSAPPFINRLLDLNLEVEPLSRRQVEFPLIDELHQASMLENSGLVSEWREQRIWRSGRQLPEEGSLPLQPISPDKYPQKSLEAVIVRRGSARNFKQLPISFTELSTMLQTATLGFESDWLEPPNEFLNGIYINIHAVEGLSPGAYRFWQKENALELLKEGDFRGHSAHLCLGQALGGTASATVFFLANLDAILKRFGNRGYRLVQMEAGILGGKLYLSAYAMGRGATGLTFFDNDTVAFFDPASKMQEAVFVIALGVPDQPGQRTGRLVMVSPGKVIP